MLRGKRLAVLCVCVWIKSNPTLQSNAINNKGMPNRSEEDWLPVPCPHDLPICPLPGATTTYHRTTTQS